MFGPSTASIRLWMHERLVIGATNGRRWHLSNWREIHGDAMKVQYQTEIRADRISTREELFEVMDLLCSSGKSEFTRKPENDEDGSYNAAADKLTANTDADAADEISSLTELLVGELERPN
jgi:hypothetical protein